MTNDQRSKTEVKEGIPVSEVMCKDTSACLVRKDSSKVCERPRFLKVH